MEGVEEVIPSRKFGRAAALCNMRGLCRCLEAESAHFLECFVVLWQASYFQFEMPPDRTDEVD